MAPKKAGRKPWIVNPGTNEAASFNMSALMTNQKMPRVRIVSGNVRIFRIRPIVAFASPTTSAAISAAPKPLRSKPGNQVSDGE